MTRSIAVAVVVPSMILASEGRAQDIFWANPAGGNWNEASNWSPANVPNLASEFARIELDGVLVELLDPLSVGGLSITRPDSTLRVTPNGRLNIIANQPIRNHGLILLRAENADFFTRLAFPTDSGFEGDGTLRLDALGESHRAARVQSNIRVRNHAGHTIAGTGLWENGLDNDGVVRADVNGKLLEFTLGARTNTGVFGAVDGGILRVGTGYFIQSGGGRIQALSGGVVELGGPTIFNGLLRTEGEGLIRFIPATTELRTTDGPPLTLDGHVHIVNHAEVTVRDSGLINHGLVEINPDNMPQNSRLRVSASNVELGGSGRVSMRIGESLESGAIITFSGNAITHGGDHSITGSGWIEGGFINRGLIRADRDGEALVLRQSLGNFTNIGLMEARDAGALKLAKGFGQNRGINDPIGQIIAGHESRVEIDGVEILFGRLESEGSGRFVSTVGGTSLVGLTLAGRLEFPATGQLRIIDGNGEFLNHGSIVINPEGEADGARVLIVEHALRGEGEVILNQPEGSAAKATLTFVQSPRANGEHHTLAGRGSVRGPMTNHGIISPGLPIGEIVHMGNFTQGPSGTLIFDIAAGRAEHDRYLVDGAGFSATLAGTIRVRLIENHQPPIGSRFVLLHATAGIVGRFEHSELPESTDEARWMIQYTANEVHAVRVCPADFNGDGTPNIFDFLAFQTAFGLGDPAADYTGDGELNLFDFLAFQAAFGHGC